MDSKPLAEIRKIVNEKDRNLLSTDPRLKHSVRVVEEDGTIYDVPDSFYEKEGEWYVVYSEHHPPYIVNVSDTVYINQYLVVKQNGGI